MKVTIAIRANPPEVHLVHFGVKYTALPGFTISREFEADQEILAALIVGYEREGFTVLEMKA